VQRGQRARLGEVAVRARSGAGIALLGLTLPTASTTFIQAEGAFTGACVRESGAQVLRIASAPGTPVPKASPTADWGLHLIDANIALGELVQVVGRQIRGFSPPARPR
jgi:hypothetical protein